MPFLLSVQFDTTSWIVIPCLIFLARTVDMSIDTIRVIMLSRGNRLLAPILGFVEVLIWLLAIGQVFRHLDNPAAYVGFAGGFATGNFVGLVIEGRLAMGMQIVRVITRRDASELVGRLRAEGHGLTVVRGEGSTGPVSILFMVLKRKALASVLESVRELHPKAFYSVEDVRSATEGVFPARGVNFWRRLRKRR